jgi:hypothetical protein
VKERIEKTINIPKELQVLKSKLKDKYLYKGTIKENGIEVNDIILIEILLFEENNQKEEKKECCNILLLNKIHFVVVIRNIFVQNVKLKYVKIV